MSRLSAAVSSCLFGLRIWTFQGVRKSDKDVSQGKASCETERLPFGTLCFHEFIKAGKRPHLNSLSSVGSNFKMPLANRLPGQWRGSGSLPLIVSHRAGGNEAPENTIAALRAAQKAGSRVMQMDILPSQEGVPVIFHDKQLQRATGVDKNIMSVKVEDLPFLRERLPALLDDKIIINTRDFGAQGYTIPTLRQLLQEVIPKSS